MKHVKGLVQYLELNNKCYTNICIPNSIMLVVIIIAVIVVQFITSELTYRDSASL